MCIAGEKDIESYFNHEAINDDEAKSFMDFVNFNSVVKRVGEQKR